MAEKPDCRTCGACCICFHDQEAYCDLTEEDEERLSRAFVKKNVVHEFTLSPEGGWNLSYGVLKTRWKKMKRGPFRGYEMNACVALRGSIMHRTSCSIYENRPQVCRDAVKPGTRGCKEVRTAFLQRIEQIKEER